MRGWEKDLEAVPVEGVAAGELEARGRAQLLGPTDVAKVARRPLALQAPHARRLAEAPQAPAAPLRVSAQIAVRMCVSTKSSACNTH